MSSALGLHVLGVCGSLQLRSSNRELLELAAELAPAHGMSMEISDALRELPHFDPDLESSPPEVVRNFRARIAASDALLITCPEYGHSLPGSLKNAIDWTIGSGELERKVVAITAATVAPFRGLLGLQALRQTLGAVSARIVGGSPIARGANREAELATLLDQLFAAASARES